MTSEALLMSLCRLCARRGLPLVIYSDNARAFKKASKDLQKLCKMPLEEPVAGHMSSKDIKSKLNVPNVPWCGGWWKRLVKTVKTPLRKVLRRACLSSEEVMTMLGKVGEVVISRPLNVIESEADEPYDLTPTDLLIGQTLTTIPQDSGEEIEKPTRTEAMRRMEYRSD
ncbi:hypothetical protein HPB50_003166 [Hyalomma asiaticum]|uniref:Uncharacterized protein n=1 Tax=Hyalomma asiaticum TaxID=266040 RepID=A0ACB7T487_HYAAI|nr:hypothetical protein HPB50_003166 [Hyalomma asiaticum]